MFQPQVRLVARDSVQQVTCCAKSRASKPLAALCFDALEISNFLKMITQQKFLRRVAYFQTWSQEKCLKILYLHSNFVFNFAERSDGNISKDYEKDEATLWWKKLEMIMKKKKRNRKLKKLDALEATWDRWSYLQFDQYNLLLFESSKVTSTPQTLTTKLQRMIYER